MEEPGLADQDSGNEVEIGGIPRKDERRHHAESRAARDAAGRSSSRRRLDAPRAAAESFNGKCRQAVNKR
jgi:hypothetical protein